MSEFDVVEQAWLQSSRMECGDADVADRNEIADVRTEAEALDTSAHSVDARRLAGRVLARREMGKLTFLDLVDRSGRIQLFCEQSVLEGLDLDLGDIVGAIGRSMKTRRGEPSLRVGELEPLAKIRLPLPDIYHGLTDVETRFRKRYLDLLVNEETRRDALLGLWSLALPSLRLPIRPLRRRAILLRGRPWPAIRMRGAAATRFWSCYIWAVARCHTPS